MPDIPNPLLCDVSSDSAKRHSTALTDGPDRAAARGMLKAIGFGPPRDLRPWSGAEARAPARRRDAGTAPA